MTNRKERLDDGLSCRLTSSQKAHIQAAALTVGQRPAEFLRVSALAFADKVLAEDNALDAFGDYVGLVNVPTTEHPPMGFTEILLRKHRPTR